MKTKIFLLLIILSIYKENYSQPLIEQAEFLFRNNTSHEIYLIVFPVGAIFSGFYIPPTENYRKYSLLRSNQSNPAPFWQNPQYITGGTKTISPNDYILIDFDDGLYYNLEDSSEKVLGGISHAVVGVPKSLRN